MFIPVDALMQHRSIYQYMPLLTNLTHLDLSATSQITSIVRNVPTSLTSLSLAYTNSGKCLAELIGAMHPLSKLDISHTHMCLYTCFKNQTKLQVR